jgi:hypothetical protein
MPSHLEMIRGAYESFARGDVPAVLALLAPDVSWTELGSEWEGFSAVPEEFVVEADTVVALGQYSGTYKTTGKGFTAPFTHVWNFRNDKVVRFRQYTDTAVVQKALR